MPNKENVNIDVLLTEYETCIVDASQIDADIWTSSYVFLGFTVIGLSIFGIRQVKTWTEFITFIIFASMGIGFILLWRKLCLAWLKLIHVNFYRMREIEEKLNMWKERYIYFLENENKVIDKAVAAKIERVKKDALKSAVISPPTVRKIMNWVYALFIFSWVILFIKQVIFLVVGGV